MAETSTNVFSPDDLSFIRAHAKAYAGHHPLADEYAAWYVENYATEDADWQYLPAHSSAWLLWQDARNV
jgi:hypothetical protein